MKEGEVRQPVSSMGRESGAEGFETHHRLAYGDARALEGLAAGSVDLVVTSPPYPMIEMWDPCFGKLDPRIDEHLRKTEGSAAFEGMHLILDEVWSSSVKSLREGGFLCISIGDATRTLGSDFRLYSNHARIAQACQALGLNALPVILWEKQTNAPNKFMGSGMLPAGAYVTLEHEYVLIFRKGGKRVFSSRDQVEKRRQSAFFWEERNQWFSDVWDFKGERQRLNGSESGKRSAAFPFELPYRLIAMYSIEGDTVLDPFVGTGTTTLASMALGRNSVGYDTDAEILTYARNRVLSAWRDVASRTSDRLQRHFDFISSCSASGKLLQHVNKRYEFPVMTQQEVELRFSEPADLVESHELTFEVRHRPLLVPRGMGRQANSSPQVVQPTLKVWQ
jgi:modification methylase